MLHQLYKRRRLRRILQLHRFYECESIGNCAIRAFLNAIAYDKLPIFHCHSFQVVNEVSTFSGNSFVTNNVVQFLFILTLCPVLIFLSYRISLL